MHLRQLLSLSEFDQVSRNALETPATHDWHVLGAVAYWLHFASDTCHVVLSKQGDISIMDNVGREIAQARVTDEVDRNHGEAIVFTSGDWRVTSATVGAGHPIQCDPAALIKALAIARDRLASVAYLPPEMRARRMSELAEIAGVPGESLRRLSMLDSWLDRELG